MANKIDLNKLTAPASQIATKQTFADRVKANLANGASQDTPPDEYASMVPNRVCMMLDCSRSMAGSSIQDLRAAAEEYINACNFSDTSLALYTFGKDKELRGGLCRIQGALFGHVSQLAAYGDTPMHRCVSDAIDTLPLTRALLVSDGGASDWGGYYSESGDADRILTSYHEAGIPVDCVHIGQSTDGEALLKKIAERTGGIFIKFKNTGNFAKAFKYLAPSYKAMLGDGKMLRQLGADEVK